MPIVKAKKSGINPTALRVGLVIVGLVVVAIAVVIIRELISSIVDMPTITDTYVQPVTNQTIAEETVMRCFLRDTEAQLQTDGTYLTGYDVPLFTYSTSVVDDITIETKSDPLVPSDSANNIAWRGWINVNFVFRYVDQEVWRNGKARYNIIVGTDGLGYEASVMQTYHPCDY